jgi:hypothetical protein
LIDDLIPLVVVFAAAFFGMYMGVLMAMANSTAAVRWFKAMTASENARRRYVEECESELFKRQQAEREASEWPSEIEL